MSGREVIVSRGLPTHVGQESPVSLYLASLGTDESRRTMRRSLVVVADILGYADPVDIEWARLTVDDGVHLVSQLQKHYASPRSVTRCVSGYRRCLKFAWRQDLISTHQWEKARDFEVNVGSSPDPSVGRTFTHAEINRLFRACDTASVRGSRDAAILAALRLGLRRSEVVGLNVGDHIGDKLRVVGKGRKIRAVPTPEIARQYLDAWAALRMGDDADPLFVKLSRADNLSPKRLHQGSVPKLVRTIGQRARVDGFAMHDFRRSMITDLLAAGVDVLTVAKISGHSSIRVVKSYDRRPFEAAAKAANRLF